MDLVAHLVPWESSPVAVVMVMLMLMEVAPALVMVLVLAVQVVSPVGLPREFPLGAFDGANPRSKPDGPCE